MFVTATNKLNTPGQRSRWNRGVNPGRSLLHREEAVGGELVSPTGCLFELSAFLLLGAGVECLTLPDPLTIFPRLFPTFGLVLA